MRTAERGALCRLFALHLPFVFSIPLASVVCSFRLLHHLIIECNSLLTFYRRTRTFGEWHCMLPSPKPLLTEKYAACHDGKYEPLLEK